MSDKKTRAPFVPKKWCGIPGCGAAIKNEEFACLKHWKMVPKEIRDRIWKHFKDRDWLHLQEAHNEARAAVILKDKK